MFPKFAHVPLLDLPTNNDFLLQAYTSVSTINSIINYYDPTTGYTEGCPDFSGMRRKLKSVDLKVFFVILSLFLYIFWLFYEYFLNQRIETTKNLDEHSSRRAGLSIYPRGPHCLGQRF